MRDGQIVQVGPPVEVYGSPATRWAAQFVGEVNVLSGVARGGGVETELGVFDLRRPASGSVHVAVRPEQLELSARDGGGNAEVVAREFRGHDVLYRLRHEGGKTLLVQLPSLELHEVGDSGVRAARAGGRDGAGGLALGDDDLQLASGRALERVDALHAHVGPRHPELGELCAHALARAAPPHRSPVAQRHPQAERVALLHNLELAHVGIRRDHPELERVHGNAAEAQNVLGPALQ